MVRSLGEKRGREELRLFVAEGEKLIEEVSKSSFAIRKLYLTESYDDYGDSSMVDSAREVEYISEGEMQRITQLKSANNALALVEMAHSTDIIDSVESLRGKLTLLLDGVQNPGNLGTIIRLADWFGIENIVCSAGCADCYNPKVVQATMGAILRVKVHYCDLEQFLQGYKALRQPIYGSLLEGGEDIYTKELNPNGLIVMGSEGRGISEGVIRHLTERLYIPPFPRDVASSESLNVSIATAIICAEFRR